MSGSVPNRRSFGNKSNKSTGTKKLSVFERCFYNSTISSSLKRRELRLLNGEEENESLTDTIGKTSTISRLKSSAAKKMMMKSPSKPVSRFNESFSSRHMSPGFKAKTPRSVKKSVKENFSKKENVIKPPFSKKPTPPKTWSKKLNCQPKPVEGIDFNFEIPTNLLKKRDKKAVKKAVEKVEQDNGKGFQKEFTDITNQNLDVISNTTPMRCITGKSSVVRSDLSFLNSNCGSGKSSPNITPYKVMRRSKENGKDGSNNITSLEQKIKELEEQIMKSKAMKDDDEEDAENNDFLDGMSQVDGNKLILEKPKQPVIKKAEPVVIEEPVEEKPVEVEEPVVKEPEEETKSEPEEVEEEIADLDNMLGKVFSTIENNHNLSPNLKDKIKSFETLTTDLMKSVKGNNVDFKTSEGPLSSSVRSRKSSQTPKNRPGRRRRSKRNKKKYESIDLYRESSCCDEEWFKDNEVWTRSRMRRKQGDHK